MTKGHVGSTGCFRFYLIERLYMLCDMAWPRGIQLAICLFGSLRTGCGRPCSKGVLDFWPRAIPSTLPSGDYRRPPPEVLPSRPGTPRSRRASSTRKTPRRQGAGTRRPRRPASAAAAEQPHGDAAQPLGQAERACGSMTAPARPGRGARKGRAQLGLADGRRRRHPGSKATPASVRTQASP